VKRLDTCARFYTRLVQYLARPGRSEASKTPADEIKRLAAWLCRHPSQMTTRDVAALLLWAALRYESSQHGGNDSAG